MRSKWMPLSFNLLWIFLIIISLNQITSAQSEDSTKAKQVIVHLTDKNKITGTLIEGSSGAIKILTSEGEELEIKMDRIDRIEVVNEDEKFGNINDSRLLFAPTARMPKAGSVYLANAEIIFPFLSVSPFDFFTLGGGISIIPSAESQIYYLAPKLGFEYEDLHFAAGALIINNLEHSDNFENIGIYYGALSGDFRGVGLTAGLGYGFHGEDVAKDPMFLIGLEFKLTKSSYFISENWFLLNSKFQVVSAGFRVFGEHFAGDFGIFIPVIEYSREFSMIPWIGFVYNF